ncbi:MAG: cadmium-translocating P-type ATPase [Bacteroidetes bacterium GWF2_43_63]|uniref:Zinc-transporting ATPase n=1 Tax=bioreactor metagenome TaxID=1076179 RepID=A0A644Y0V9_9ZZZZ|nr:MAG: cadmium-translocating P-type ATPase [Bacteroidetes bacterium GWE2_42_42]OFY52650.1 MAG: cadmium-translocating P-type ATPase [Bacteroidetes bacterium GWF2_43_63]HBG69927.1 cadmium-translocating P-type ATPase [Bacteroidales bacterium]HCB62647.1 cadmium-translocating P-type ATPase [Bacteroidales bacterium]HCY23767.1 cadmium-translocating P-type ATPase [Bacteroidales bacterium]
MKKYKLKNLDCASCASKIEGGVAKLEDVKFVNVNFATSTLTIDADNMEKVKARIKEIEPEVEIEDNDKVKTIVSTNELVENKWAIIKATSGLLLLLAGMIFEGELHNTPFHIAEYAVFVVAYLIVGWNVIASAVKNIARGQVFNEQFLMTIATLGAFAIAEMPEAVAVMLFYIVGELFQDIAVGRSRKSIKALLEIKPDYANLKSGAEIQKVSPEEVKIGDTIIVKPGEKVPLDGRVLDGTSFVDTAALTGESVPRKVKETDEVLAGMINQSGLLIIEVKKTFGESSISRILELVENATSQKAETEKFITTFAKYYTPAIVFSALLLAVIPPLIITGATFGDWIYRALVVLVISCPCALVISIPLGYFGGVGRASRKGILVKGSNFLDALTQVKTVVFDKTGTLTKGDFKVSEIVTSNGYSKEEILKYAAYAESGSNHPVAKSITDAFHNKIDNTRIKQAEEISGHGIKAIIDDKAVLAGNDKLLHKENIDHPICNVEGTVVHIAFNKVYAGHIIISDNLKDDAKETIEKLKARNIQTVMLTGDNKYAAEFFAKKLGIDRYYSELLPEDKVKHIENLINENKVGKVAFVGDGINDAPVIARADVGIAMGALGSDAAIETADVVLMTDSPSKVIDAIDVAKKTRNIVWQNIIFAMGIKLIFIVLGIFGIATMWEAVFGDIGVALIAVFNAIRILRD